MMLKRHFFFKKSQIAWRQPQFVLHWSCINLISMPNKQFLHKKFSKKNLAQLWLQIIFWGSGSYLRVCTCTCRPVVAQKILHFGSNPAKILGPALALNHFSRFWLISSSSYLYLSLVYSFDIWLFGSIALAMPFSGRQGDHCQPLLEESRDQFGPD